jgi:hypothetical protein
MTIGFESAMGQGMKKQIEKKLVCPDFSGARSVS